MYELVGLIPAAGQARRLAQLPCSKEIFPVGFINCQNGDREECCPKPVSLYLIERLRRAEVKRAFLILNKEKCDIIRYYGNGTQFGLSLAYLIQEKPLGMPDAINQAYPWIKSQTVLFGMPDTIFYPEDAYSILLDNHRQTGADLTLGLFPTNKPERFGMVSYDQNYSLIYTIDKPVQTQLKYMWGIGCWKFTFTEFLMEEIRELIPRREETILGDIFQAAMEAGLAVKVVPFEQGEYIDIGNLEDLTHAIQDYSRQ